MHRRRCFLHDAVFNTRRPSLPMNSNLVLSSISILVLSTLAACGGGGSSSDGSSPTQVSSPSPAPSPAPAPAPAPITATATPVPTQAPGVAPTLTASSCPPLLSPTLASPTISGADMQAASDVLAAVDPSHAYAEFAKLPATFTYWLRAGGSAVDLVSLGTATHETNHEVDRALRSLCNTDDRYRYFVAGTVYTTDLLTRSTANYSIVSETYPAALAASRATRYGVYITGSASASGNTFGVLLDELTAYSGGADLERRILATPSLAYLVRSGDLNAGGMTDFMSFLQFYLTSARLNHGQSYAAIQSSAATVAYLQVAWTRAERILGELYPYSTAAVGITGQTVPIDVLRAIYSADALHGLDALGITHKTAADYATTYLR